MGRVFVASYSHYYMATSFTGYLLIAITQIYFHIAHYSTLFKKYVYLKVCCHFKLDHILVKILHCSVLCRTLYLCIT